jgi:hypothetical protein
MYSAFGAYFQDLGGGASAAPPPAPPPPPPPCKAHVVEFLLGGDVRHMAHLEVDTTQLSAPPPDTQVYFVFDLSISMRQHFRDCEAAMKENFVDAHGGDRNTVILFGSDAVVIDSGSDDAAAAAAPHFRSGMGATNYETALVTLGRQMADLPLEIAVHIRYFTDGVPNRGRLDFGTIWKQHVQPTLQRRPGSTMEVWFMGSKDSSLVPGLKTLTYPSSADKVIVMNSAGLLQETKLVAALATTPIHVDTNLGAFHGPATPGVVVLEKLLPPGTPPDTLLVNSIDLGSAPALPQPLALALQVTGGTPQEGNFVLSTDPASPAARQDMLAVLRQQLQTASDSRMAELVATAADMVTTLGTAHSDTAAMRTVQVLARTLERMAVSITFRQGKKGRLRRKAAGKMAKQMSQSRQIMEKLPGQVAELLGEYLRQERPCEPGHDDLIMLTPTEATLPPGEFPVLVLASPGSQLRSQSGMSEIPDVDDLPAEMLTTIVAGGSYARVVPKGLCLASTMRRLVASGQTTVVGTDDPALPILPDDHPALPPLVQLLASFLATGVPGLDLGLRMGDIFPASLFTALAAGDAVPIFTLLAYTRAYLRRSTIFPSPVITVKECGTCFVTLQEKSALLPPRGTLIDETGTYTLDFSSQDGHLRVPAGSPQVPAGTRLRLQTPLGAQLGLPMAKVPIMDYIVALSRHITPNLRDQEMQLGRFFETQQQAFVLLLVALLERQAQGEATADQEYEKAVRMLLQGMVWARSKPDTTTLKDRIMRMLAQNPAWTSFSGAPPPTDTVLPEMRAALVRGDREEVDQVLRRSTGLRRQLPADGLPLDRTTHAELQTCCLDLLNRSDGTLRPLGVPFKGDPFRTLLGAVRAGQALLREMPAGAWERMRQHGGLPPADLDLAVEAALRHCPHLSSSPPAADPEHTFSVPCDWAALLLEPLCGWAPGQHLPPSLLAKLPLTPAQNELEEQRQADLLLRLTADVLEKRDGAATAALAALLAGLRQWEGMAELHRTILQHVEDGHTLALIFDALPSTVFDDEVFRWFQRSAAAISSEQVQEKRGKPGRSLLVPGSKKFQARTRAMLLLAMMVEQPHADELAGLNSLQLLRFFRATGNRPVTQRLLGLLRKVPSDRMVVQFTTDGHWRVLELSDLKPACHYHNFHEIRCRQIEDETPQRRDWIQRDRQISFFDDPQNRPDFPTMTCPQTGNVISDFRMTLECVLQGRELPSETQHLDLSLAALNRTALY